MKIGFFAYNLTILWRYWKKLNYKADCWWGVPERRVYEILKAQNIKNVVYYHEEYVIDLKKNLSFFYHNLMLQVMKLYPFFLHVFQN